MQGRPVLLLFGLAESEVDAAARAVHAGGATLARDAATAGERFGVSAGLDRLATEIDASFGMTGEVDGPLILANAGFETSRRKIAVSLERHRASARDAFTHALPGDDPRPVVIAAGAMAAFPRFWLGALAEAGARAVPVLVHRDPITLAKRARSARRRPLRQTVFAWHHLALEVLAASPAEARVLDGPAFDPATLDVGLTDTAAPAIRRDDADPAESSLLSAQSRELLRLVSGWRDLGADARSAAIGDLAHRFDEAVTLTGAARIVTRPHRGNPAVADEPVAAPASDRSPLLIHYHIFKNAGTSVDRMLKANFGDRWADREFSDTPARRHASIREFLEARPELRAFSSHTAPLPLPDLPDREIVPILFVRQPLLRARSAYEFERRQDATTRGAILAKQTDLAGYVTALLDDPRARQVRNFQAIRFAAGTPGRPAQELERALATLDRLPFVGLVEAYDESVARLGEVVRPLFPEFRVIALHENATGGDRGAATADQLAALREELGAALYDRLAEANRSDLALYESVRARYATAR